MAKEKNGISDEECARKSEPLEICCVHRQPLMDCANDRLRQVKQAREMAERRTRWALAWREFACNTRKEINALKGPKVS